MKSDNWKKVKKIMGEFTNSPKAAFFPLFVHANLEPVKMSNKLSSFFEVSQSEDFTFNYLIYLGKVCKGDSFFYYSKLYVGESSAAELKVVEDNFFEPSQTAEVIHYLRTPSRTFEIEGRHKMVLSYPGENKDIDHLIFENQVEIWRKTFQTQN